MQHVHCPSHCSSACHCTLKAFFAEQMCFSSTTFSSITKIFSIQSAICFILQQRQQEFTNYRDYIGMDITSLVALPVWIMMPFSMLQNISEIMEYTDRLEKAAKTEDPYER